MPGTTTVTQAVLCCEVTLLRHTFVMCYVYTSCVCVVIVQSLPIITSVIFFNSTANSTYGHIHIHVHMASNFRSKGHNSASV